MNISRRIEKQRRIMQTLKNWDAYIQDEREKAIYGTGRSFDDIKVQTTKQHDRLENAILDLQELEEKRIDMLNEYYNNVSEITDIVFEYARTMNQAQEVLNYMRGDQADNTKIKKALEHIQHQIDILPEAELHKPAIKNMIMGKEETCPKCGRTVKLKEEKEDCFLFKCRGCKTIFRAMRKLAYTKLDA